jgi:hypothetical protein
VVLGRHTGAGVAQDTVHDRGKGGEDYCCPPWLLLLLPPHCNNETEPAKDAGLEDSEDKTNDLECEVSAELNESAAGLTMRPAKFLTAAEAIRRIPQIITLAESHLPTREIGQDKLGARSEQERTYQQERAA